LDVSSPPSIAFRLSLVFRLGTELRRASDFKFLFLSAVSRSLNSRRWKICYGKTFRATISLLRMMKRRKNVRRFLYLVVQFRSEEVFKAFELTCRGCILNAGKIVVLRLRFLNVERDVVFQVHRFVRSLLWSRKSSSPNGSSITSICESSVSLFC